ncbi:MAG TPA: hypothetical protein VFI54_06400 [Solirubrobacteraceae bacterium]|nr:hypothetical protein [Solirubrobacteraceae bacterium]
MTQPGESDINVRNPGANDLMPSTRLEVTAQTFGFEGDYPMMVSARFDAASIGVAYGRTFCEALRNLADVLEDVRPSSGPPVREFWSAYYPDWSGVVVFTNELAALRYAVEHTGMSVAKVLPGIPVGEQV